MRKFLAIGDLHYGWDKNVSPSGKWTKRPVHNLKAFQVTMEFARDFKPDIVLLMGDMFDMGPLCRHTLDLQGEMEGQRLLEVYERSREEIIEPILKLNAGEYHWVDGNHEAWARKFALKYPGIDGLIDPFRALGLREKGIQYHPQGSIVRIGKLAWAHGDTITTSSTTAAKQAVEKYGSSIRIFHWHTYQTYTKPTLKNNAYQTGIVVPCLSTRGPKYQKTPINAWVNGFNYGCIDNRGGFHDYISILFQGRMVDMYGKEYAA